MNLILGNTTNGASDSNQDENVYETVDDCLVQSPPPSYDYIQSSKMDTSCIILVLLIKYA